MTPQELKHSIIFLALQGKLVGQIKGDSPIDLSGIKSKKTEECEFDIPYSWGLAHLEAVTNGIPSKQYQILESEVQQTGKYPVISQSKAYSIGFSDNSEKVYHHTKPVIIFGDHTTEVKYVEFDFIVGADGVKIFEPIDGIVTADFLYYVFLFYSKDLSKVGGYSRHYKFIKNKPIPLPPLAEQKRIVAKIEELLPLIDRYEQAWSKLEEFNKRFPLDMQKSILQMAIQGKLAPQLPEEGTGEELFQQIQAEKQALIKAGKIKKEKPLPEITEDELPFDIPENWKWVQFGTLYSLSNGTASRGSKDGSEHPVLRLADLSNNVVDTNNIRKIKLTDKEFAAHMVQEDDLIFIRVNGSKDRVATAFRYTAKDTISYCDHLFCGHKCSALVDADFIMFIFNCPSTRRQLLPEIKTTAGQNTISQSSMAKILLPLPPLAEQKRIVAKLEEILPLCERLK